MTIIQRPPGTGPADASARVRRRAFEKNGLNSRAEADDLSQCRPVCRDYVVQYLRCSVCRILGCASAVSGVPCRLPLDSGIWRGRSIRTRSVETQSVLGLIAITVGGEAMEHTAMNG